MFPDTLSWMEVIIHWLQFNEELFVRFPLTSICLDYANTILKMANQICCNMEALAEIVHLCRSSRLAWCWRRPDVIHSNDPLNWANYIIDFPIPLKWLCYQAVSLSCRELAGQIAILVIWFTFQIDWWRWYKLCMRICLFEITQIVNLHCLFGH